MSMSPLAWSLVALLLSMLAVAVGTALVLWRRARPVLKAVQAAQVQIAELQRPMIDAAMRVMYPRNGDYRYDKPCVMVCGPQGVGKSDLLRGAGLEPVEALAGMESGWWRSTEGVAFELPAAAWEADDGHWFEFLRHLDRHRGQRALDAIVWLIPLDALEKGEASGERMYRKFADIQDRLGLSLPVYVVIGGCDKVEGFAQWSARLPLQARRQALGWSNPNSLDTAWRVNIGEQGVARLANQLRRLVNAVGAERELGRDAAGVFLMPERISRALTLLPQVLQDAMRQNAVMTPFQMRGFYLTGRMAPEDGSTVAASVEMPADPFAPQPAAAPSAPPVFCRDLFSQRVFGEFGLATLVERRIAAERRTRRMVLTAAALLSAIWLASLVPTYFTMEQRLLAMRKPLLGVQSAVLSARARSGASTHFDERATAELLTELDRVPNWNTRSPALPLSWWSCCGGLERQIDGALRSYYEQVLFKSVDQALVDRADELTRQHVVVSGSDADLASTPERMAQFAALNKFVDDTLEFEYQRGKYHELTERHRGTWKEMTGLLNYLFGLQLSAGTRTASHFDEALHSSSYLPTHKGEDTDMVRFQARLTQLHRNWHERLFGNTRLSELQRQLAIEVQALDSDKLDQQGELARLQRSIGELRTLLTRNDLAWMADGTLITDEPYRKLDAKIRKSSLLGANLASQLHTEVTGKQKAFRMAVESDSTGPFPVLSYSEGKELLVNADLAGLEQALGQLLLHPFTQGAVGETVAAPNAGTPLAWNLDLLASARAVLADLQAYEMGELTKAPPTYQPVLRKLARLQAGAMISRDLSNAAAPASCDARWRCANFDDARQVAGPLLASLRRLELSQVADHWQRLMDRQAVVLLAELRMVAEEGSLYVPAPSAVLEWNGARAGAPVAYGVRAPGEVQDYLDSQLALVSDLATASKGPRAWLSQGGALTPRDTQAWISGWTRVDAELARHATKAPGGTLKRLEQWISEDLATLDSTNCAARLTRVSAGTGDLFQRRMASAAAAFRPRCLNLEASVTISAYSAIASHFNEHLYNRYPFSAARDAAPADPDHVRQLLQLLDAHLPTARATLGRQKDTQSAAALAFLDRLAGVQPLLAAVLADDPVGGPAALDLWPQFRVNRGREKGADQIIEWNVKAGDRLPPPAGSLNAGVSWRMGEPIGMSLRWARNSLLAPAANPSRPDMKVTAGVASWQYDDHWALLRLLADHASPVSDLGERDARAPNVLRFVVPTRNAAGAPADDAVAYARLAVSIHGKPERLAVAPFPTSAAPPLRAAGARTTLATTEKGASP